MTQTLETIERRINALGLTEPTIQPHGRVGKDNEILVQLPGEGDPAAAKRVIQAGGQLELKLVEDPQTYPSEAAALAAKGGVLPPGTELVQGKQRSHATPTPEFRRRVVFVAAARLPSPDEIYAAPPKAAAPKCPASGKSISSSPSDAGRNFGRFTEQNMGRQMAIVLDKKVYSAPTIQGKIEDTGAHRRQFQPGKRARTRAESFAPAPCPPRSSILKSAPLARPSAQTPSAMACKLP